jgi:hypothetical protein
MKVSMKAAVDHTLRALPESRPYNGLSRSRMKMGYRWAVRFATTVGLALVVSVSWAGQSSQASESPSKRVSPTKAWTPPRTPWGDPDLQGLWPGTDFVGVPLVRADSLGTRNELTDTEFTARLAAAQKQTEDDNAEFDISNVPPEVVARGTVGGPVSPPPHWLERGKPSRQASLIVDPPDGKLPPQAEAAQKRAAERQNARYGRGPADSYEDRSLYDRCITRGVLGSILPVIYNNRNEIVQAPGIVAIRNEMIHETRIVPLDGRPHLSSTFHQYMGDSRGHWEGNTLVVETTNLTDRTGAGGNGGANLHSRAARLVEKFTRTGSDTLRYEVTIDDPQTWTRPWTVAFPWRLDAGYGFYEYACHEGNYALTNILSGARAEEAGK